MDAMTKKVIIIGATSGIGRELAKLYAERGALVGVTGRRQALLDSLQAEYPDHIYIARFDVTASVNIPQLETLIGRLGGLDLLHYNAGYGDISKSLDYSIDKRTTDTNVNGFVEIVNYAFNYFTKQGYGHLAVTSSIAALMGNSWSPAYSASKAFASNYFEGLSIKALRLKNGITCTDIKAGFINTKLAKGNKRFWVASPEKAARQILNALEKKKRVVYISRRWAIIAWLLKLSPYALYKRFV